MHIKHLLEHKNVVYIAILWTVVIIVLSLVSFSNIKLPAVAEGDKVAHLVFYSGFVVLWNIVFLTINKKKLVFIVAILFGIIIEVLQENCTKTRTFDVNDILANSVGALAGWMITNVLHYFYIKK